MVWLTEFELDAFAMALEALGKQAREERGRVYRCGVFVASRAQIHGHVAREYHAQHARDAPVVAPGDPNDPPPYRTSTLFAMSREAMFLARAPKG